MRRRALDTMDLLARLFDVGRAGLGDEEQTDEGDLKGVTPSAPPPSGDPRLGMRVLARLIADEARRGEAPDALARGLRESLTQARRGEGERSRSEPSRRGIRRRRNWRERRGPRSRPQRLRGLP